MRRLPVYLLLDTSGSMAGEPIEAVKNGVQIMISTLRQNPQAIETGVTALGDGLSLLANKIDSEVAKTTTEQKGDWKPLVFIMTDGIPTDNWQNGLIEFKKRKTAFTVACAAGPGADTNILKQITENVVSLDTADSTTIGKFFQWVTASIGVSSTRVEDSGKEVQGLNELPPPPSELNIVI
jgi:uncharacterized protein YegL